MSLAGSIQDQDVFKALGGFEIMEKILSMLAECGGETASSCPAPAHPGHGDLHPPAQSGEGPGDRVGGVLHSQPP